MKCASDGTSLPLEHWQCASFQLTGLDRLKKIVKEICSIRIPLLQPVEAVACIFCTFGEHGIQRHPAGGIHYLRCTNIVAGVSRKPFHKLEKRDMVAPSMTLWSADQLTCMMCALIRFSSASNRGSSLICPMAPMHTVGWTMTGLA